MPIRDAAAIKVAKQLLLPRLTRMKHSEAIVKMAARLIQAAVATDEQRAKNEKYAEQDNAAKESK